MDKFENDDGYTYVSICGHDIFTWDFYGGIMQAYCELCEEIHDFGLMDE